MNEDKSVQLMVRDQSISLNDVGAALAELSSDQFLVAVRQILKTGDGDHLQLLIQGIEIQMTPSAFHCDQNPNLEKVEEVAQRFPFSRWLDNMGIEYVMATRDHLCKWWNVFMFMASECGYQPFGRIDQVGRTVNLWKATGPLAAKMQRDAAAYRYLPALLINHPQEVERVLGELKEAQPFLEVLTGERLEDLRNSPVFLGAFSVVRGESGTISREVPDVLFGLAMILQR